MKAWKSEGVIRHELRSEGIPALAMPFYRHSTLPLAQQVRMAQNAEAIADSFVRFRQKIGLTQVEMGTFSLGRRLPKRWLYELTHANRVVEASMHDPAIAEKILNETYERVKDTRARNLSSPLMSDLSALFMRHAEGFEWKRRKIDESMDQAIRSHFTQPLSVLGLQPKKA